MARVRLPDPALVPVLRESLEQAADFRVTDLYDNIVDLVPAEGAGVTRSFLQAHRLCGRQTRPPFGSFTVTRSTSPAS
jgi:hypothetical protein